MLVRQHEGELFLTFPGGISSWELGRLKTIPGHRFDDELRGWFVPNSPEVIEELRRMAADFGDWSPPKTGPTSITAFKKLLRIRVPENPVNDDLCRRIPDYKMWQHRDRAWYAKPTPLNLRYLKTTFPDAVWDAEASGWWDGVVEDDAQAAMYLNLKRVPLESLVQTDDYKHGGPPPFDWQKRCFLISRDRPAFAIFAEQRTGKTKVGVDTAAYLYIRGKIRQVLVLSPNSVKTNWITEEIPMHMPSYIPWLGAYWSSSPTKATKLAIDKVIGENPPDKLLWFSMNIEALSSERGLGVALAYCGRAPTLIIIDESTKIKTPSTERTKAAFKLAKLAPYRRIMTGVQAPDGPLDTYTQGYFLDPRILGYGSFYSFRNHFAILGGFKGREVKGYHHLDELQRLWDPHSFRITRDECFDIPPKGYQKLVVEMNPEQQRAYTEMRKHMETEVEGRKLTATIVLAQLTRLQQIAGGFVPIRDDPEDPKSVRDIPLGKTNPKIDALLELVEEVQGKVLIWARFKAEISAAAAALRKAYGPHAVVEFHGDIKDDARIYARQAFQDPESPVRFLVGQPGTGGYGLNFDQARTIVHLSNSFDWEERSQAEDRSSSSRQKYSVAIVDIVADGTKDEKVLRVLKEKRSIAAVIAGDTNLREWIS